MKRLAVAIALLLAAPAYAAHGIALWGELKYKQGFAHFDYVNPNAPKGGTLRLSTSGAFDSTNPFILKGVAAPGISAYVYQSLMVGSYDEPQSYYPLIASSITLAPDRSYADFTLNPKARWSDGKSITAEDVVWSLETLKEKGHPSLKVQFKPITIKALGPHTVRFMFADKAMRELPLIAASLPVMPKHVFCATDTTRAFVPPTSGGRLGGGLVEGVADNQPPPQPSPSGGGSNSPPTNSSCIPFDKTSLTPPIGSGPYIVSKIEAGRSITFTRDKNYWAANLPTQRGFHNFDTIRVDVYRDDTVALEGIKSHQFDYYEEFIARNWATAYNIPAVESGALVKTKIANKIPRGMQGFIFNTREAKFTDRRVREAIGLTLDFQWMNQTLFYGAYERGRSYFNNTEFEAKGLPDAGELKLLESYRNAQAVIPPHSGGRLGGGLVEGTADNQPPPQPSPGGGGSNSPTPYSLPPALFTTEYTVPTTDGSGIARANLIRAQRLLNEAGWVMKDGKRINAKTGEALTIEFLMHQKTFERVIGIMRHNLKKLGIDSTFRYVDASQYQKRLEKKQFDIVSVWWNLGLFYPSTEQYRYWHSSQADIEGSQNIGGVKNPAVDALVEKIQSSQQLDQLRPAARALDRVLTHEHYIIPHWNLSAWRVAYWNQFGRPDITPAYNLGIDTWWDKKVTSHQSPVTSAAGKNLETGDWRLETQP